MISSNRGFELPEAYYIICVLIYAEVGAMEKSDGVDGKQSVKWLLLMYSKVRIAF